MKIQKRLRFFSASRVSYWPRVVFAGLMFLSLGMLSIQMASPGSYQGFRTLFMDALNPVFAFASGLTQGVSQTIGNLADLSTLRMENDTLIAENQRLKLSEQATQKLRDENLHLRGQLHVVADLPPSFVTARIISDTSSGLVRSFVINAGRHQGIKKGQSVLADGNFIGRVQDLADDSSRVVLITDFASKIPVVVGASSEQGIIAGDNSDILRLIYIAQPQAVNSGDPVITSGKGGGIPPGLPIGRVDRWDGTQFRIFPNVDLASLRFVQIVDYGLQSLLDQLDGGEFTTSKSKPRS